MEGAQSFSGDAVQFSQPIRPLHWVIKIGNLKQSMELLGLLGARILRHEEFKAGCEATCNGPYTGYWSKSMVGWENEDNSFVFELTYNYGIDQYARGNDLKCIQLYKFNNEGVDMENKMLTEFDGAMESLNQETGIYHLLNDDFMFKFVDAKAPSTQLIEGLTLNCTNLDENLRFWSKLGLKKDADAANFTFDGYDYFRLYIEQVQSIQRCDAFGRIAISCADADVEKVFSESGAKVVNAPVTLKTEGKADVVVTILQTPDDQEICFVNDIGFRDLSQETKEQVDWKMREKQATGQKKYLDRVEKIEKKQAQKEAENQIKEQKEEEKKMEKAKKEEVLDFKGMDNLFDF